MSNRSLALAVATLVSMYIGSAEAQSVYVAPAASILPADRST